MQIFASQYIEKEKDGKQNSKIYLSHECEKEGEPTLDEGNLKHITVKADKKGQCDDENNESSLKDVCKKGLKSARAHLIRQKTEQFINLLFWHSMLMTLTTPLARLTRGRWSSASLLYWGVLMFCWLYYWKIDLSVKDDSEEPLIDESFVYKTENKVKGVDSAFGFHAFSGLLWILTAWVQMSLLKTSKRWHRIFGMFAIVTFGMHMAGSLNNLYFDYMKHTPLPKLLLAMACMDSIVSMVAAMMHAKRKNFAGHRDAMIRCFIYSIEGAGTIRTVGTLQAFLGLGPTDCQVFWNGTASNCLYSYTWRLLLTRYLSLSYLGLYTIHRNEKHVLKNYLLEVLWFSLLSTFLLNSKRMMMVDMVFQAHPIVTIPAFFIIITGVRIILLRRDQI